MPAPASLSGKAKFKSWYVLANIATNNARLASNEDVATAQSIAVEQRGVCGAPGEAPDGDKLGMCSSIPPCVDPAVM
jgi:hypothetical protein